MTAHVIPIRGTLTAQLERSVQLAPRARKTGVSIREIDAQMWRDREERRRTKLRGVDLARARNESDCCADCNEPLGIRVRLAWDPHEMVVRCLACGRK